MSWPARAVAGALAVFTVACASDPVAVEQVQRPEFAVAATCSESLGRVLSNFNDYWSCGQTIRINMLSLTGTFLSDAQFAIADWNNALSAQRLGLPVLSETTGSPAIRINLSGTGTQYCGQVLPVPPATPSSINISPGNCGTFRDVLLHELSHVWGFADAWEKMGTSGVSDNCARFLPGGKASNGSVCRHEVESLHWKYQIRSGAQVSLSKHIITGLGGLGSITIPVNSTGTLRVSSLVFARSQCDEAGTCPTSPTGLTFSWSVSPAGVISLSGTDPMRTVTGVSPGTATVTVTPSTTTYELASELTGNIPTVTVTANPPAGPPSNLTATSITATSARLNWTNGDASAGTTTFIQYRPTGTTAWLKANGGTGLAAGVSTYLLSGLHCATTYDVNIYHVKNGSMSTQLTLTLFTTSACPNGGLNPPTAFRVTSSTCSAPGGKQYLTYNVAWTAGTNSSSTLWHIVESLSNAPSTASIIQTGSISTVSSNLRAHLSTATASPRYFWIHYVNGNQSSVWVPIQGNPLAFNSCAV